MIIDSLTQAVVEQTNDSMCDDYDDSDYEVEPEPKFIGIVTNGYKKEKEEINIKKEYEEIKVKKEQYKREYVPPNPH